MNNESERIDKLTQLVEKMDQDMSEFAGKVARLNAANDLILHAIRVAIVEIDPSVADVIPKKLELMRNRTNGDPIMFQAIEDALKFFRS